VDGDIGNDEGNDLFLYCRGEGTLLGENEEYILSPKLDDLECACGCLEGFLAAKESGNIAVSCIFDNEEVMTTPSFIYGQLSGSAYSPWLGCWACALSAETRKLRASIIWRRGRLVHQAGCGLDVPARHAAPHRPVPRKERAGASR